MPTVSENSHILLTGASGFLAAHIAQQLVERGFKVRGTVRSEEKGEWLSKNVLNDSKNWSYVIVEDVEQEGAFKEAVKGVDAVLHTASPFHFNVSDPHKDLINPAVQGTTNILRSSAQEKSIKRIVITSSFASIVNPYDPVYTFTEKDWNEYSPKQVEEKGKDVDPAQAYRASKTLAERAAWDFVEKEKPGFDIATVNPPLIFGPIIHDVPSPDKLNTSVANFYKFLTGEKDKDAATAAAGSLVDVRDVAKIHIDALLTDSASNERFSVSNTDMSYQPLLDLFFEKASSSLLEAFPDAQKGAPGTPKPKQNVIDNSKAKKTFGWEPISVEKTVLDMAQSLADYQSKRW